MNTKTPRHRFRFSAKLILLRLLILFVAFTGVLFLIRSLQSTEFQNFLTQLFSTGKSWNWCPPSTEHIEVLSSEPTLDNRADIQSLCMVQLEPFEADPAQTTNLRPLLRASNAAGAQTVLEGDLSSGFFRAQGLPFRSEALLRALRRDGQP
jgi:hypothetical protein